MKERKINLDIIRIAAALAVVNFHFTGVYGLTDSPLYSVKNGGVGLIGVTMFYLLSGFLLNGHTDQPLDTTAFYRKRFLALYPMIWLMFPVFYLLRAWEMSSFRYGGPLWKLIYSVLGIDSYFQLYGKESYYAVGEWFTPIILLLYLLFPLLRKLMKQAALPTLAVAGILYLINLTVGIQPGVTPDASVFTGLFLFLIGMELRTVSNALTKHRRLLLTVSAALVVLFLLVPFPRINGYRLLWTNILGISIFLLLYLAFENVSAGGKKGHILAWLSALTYPVYLCHHRIIELMAAHLTGPGIVPTYLITICIIFIVSAGFYTLLQFIKSAVHGRSK